MFAERLKKLRTEKQITQLELASILHISETAIGLYEKGKRKPKYNTLKAISEYFDCSIDYLLGNTITTNSTHIRITLNTDDYDEKDIQLIIDLITRLKK